MIVIVGPGDSPTFVPVVFSWTAIVRTVMKTITSTVVVATPAGPSVQKSSPSPAKSEIVALSDQIVGKVGPMIGEYNSEKVSRMIEEF